MILAPYIAIQAFHFQQQGPVCEAVGHVHELQSTSSILIISMHVIEAILAPYNTIQALHLQQQGPVCEALGHAHKHAL